MNLSELHNFLQNLGRRPNRALSQNFLVDENIAAKIIRTSEVSPGDFVLEIGPGTGALTAFLLAAGAHVVAIEKDLILANELIRLQTPDQRLKIFCADFLSFDLSSLFNDRQQTFKVVANLPYHITTPILVKLFEHSHHFSLFTVMMQDEAAQRLISSQKTFCTSFALFTHIHATLHSSFHVPASCFYPKPKVDSKVVRLNLRPKPLEDPASFSRLVRRAFQQKRKMLKTSLQENFSQDLLRQVLETTDIKANARPEELCFEQWRQLHRELQKCK